MPNRSSRSGPSLNNQILFQNVASFANTGVSSQSFTGVNDNRSSDAMLRRIRGHIFCRAGSTASGESVRFGIIAEQPGDIPVVSSFADEARNLWEQECTASRDTVNNWDNPAFLHFDLNLSLKVPLGRDLYFGLMNQGTVTDFAGYLVRLFWSLI